jgi:hypothetical protein
LTTNNLWSEHPTAADVASPDGFWAGYIRVPVVIVTGGAWVVDRNIPDYYNGAIVVPKEDPPGVQVFWPDDRATCVPGVIINNPGHGNVTLDVEPANPADTGFGGGCIYTAPPVGRPKKTKPVRPLRRTFKGAKKLPKPARDWNKRVRI